MNEPAKKPWRLGNRWTDVLIVIIVFVAVFMMGNPYGKRHRSSDVNATTALVHNIATAISQYSVRTWSWDDPATGRISAALWDLNHDGLLDGRPGIATTKTTDGGFPPALIASRYDGFYDMVRPTIASRFLDQHRQIIDAWGHPLRIAFAERTYGAEWFGLWSAGRDGIDGTVDDIRSWPPPGPPAIRSP